jgi:uncharacterized protein YfaS (alpha-2-macroglobulin family)
MSAMEQMFCGAQSFNQPLTMNTSKVTDMDGMFQATDSFNQPITMDMSQVTLMNNMDKAISGELFLELPPHFELLNDIDKKIRLDAKEVKVVKMKFLIGNDISFSNINITFKSDDFEDAFATNIQTVSRGFPVNEVFGDNKVSRDFEFNLNAVLEGTLDIKLTVHPNILSDLVSGVDRMFRQPSGCFEQVSSSNYPNLLALNYMRDTDVRNQQIEAKAERFLGIGYNKMKG